MTLDRADHLAPDRKRILRTLISDITITSDPSADKIRVGIRWFAGAHEALAT